MSAVIATPALADATTITATQQASSAPIDWSFLYDRFVVLRGKMSIEEPTRLTSDDLRVGRDDPNDWKICVDITAGTSVERSDPNLADRYVRTREAVILQSLMAFIDYDAWLDAVLTIAQLKPPSFVHLPRGSGSTPNQLPRRFKFAFAKDTRPEHYEWSWATAFLFRLYNWSSSFKSQLRRIHEIYKAKGVDITSVPNVPVTLHFEPDGIGKDRQQVMMKNIVDTVEMAMDTETMRKPHCDFDESLPNVPALHLERADFDFQHFILVPPILREIERLVSIDGAPIGTLTMPCRFGYDTKEEEKIRGPWASFVCAVCGVEGPQGKTPVKSMIQELDLPGTYSRHFFTVPFLMAMRDATRLKMVRVSLWSWKSADDITAESRVGGLLAYSIFHKNQSSSVETLKLSPLPVGKAYVTKMQQVGESSNPLHDLLRLASSGHANSAAQEVKPITVKKGTKLDPVWRSSWFMKDKLKTSGPWTGLIVHDDASETKIVVYLPGWGLCRIDRQSVPNKKRKVSPSAPTVESPASTDLPPSKRLRTLESDMFTHGCIREGDPDWEGPLISALGSLVGESVEGICISATTKKGAIRDILQHFPNLKTLVATGDAIDSVDSLIEAYHNGSQISSLDISHANMTTDDHDKFFQLLGTDEIIKKKLQHLSVGKFLLKGPTSTVDFAGILRSNDVLTNLHIKSDNASQWDDLLQFHGQRLPDRSSTRRPRLASLSTNTAGESESPSPDHEPTKPTESTSGTFKLRSIIVHK